MENWLTCDIEELAARIHSEFPAIDRLNATSLARRIAALHPTLRDDFIRWYQHGIAPHDMEVEGYSFRTLFAERRYTNWYNAFATMSWLLEDPKGAKEALSWPFHNVADF